jgi:hypothetical protein
MFLPSHQGIEEFHHLHKKFASESAKSVSKRLKNINRNAEIKHENGHRFYFRGGLQRVEGFGLLGHLRNQNSISAVHVCTAKLGVFYIFVARTKVACMYAPNF